MARNLQQDTRGNQLYGGDTSTSVDVLYSLSNTAHTLAQTGESDARKLEFLTELNTVSQRLVKADNGSHEVRFQHLIEAGSNLLQEEQRSAWMDLPPSNQSATADRLITAIESMAVTAAKRLDMSKPKAVWFAFNISKCYECLKNEGLWVHADPSFRGRSQ